MEKHIHALFLHLLLPLVLVLLLVANAEADQAQAMYRTFKSKNSESIPSADIDMASSAVYLAPQEGLKELDRIISLPGQPSVGFQQYAGYVTVDPQAGRALFYYFTESSDDPSSKPLVLWLNGGPGCSSLIGATTEQGPFRVNSDRKTLFSNEYSWNKVANVIFLESPAGVGFSYSNTSSDYEHTGDISTAKDSYTFLINWLARFPEYKSRDFYITGESYAGHYVPQLAHTILHHNQNATQTINLRGIAMGNAWIDDITTQQGIFDYKWTHALISDQTYQGIHTYCNFTNTSTNSKECNKFLSQANTEPGDIDYYNIYAPLCHASGPINGSVSKFDPCSLDYVDDYLNLPEVQAALHVKPTTWGECRGFNWNYWEPTLLPTIKNIINAGMRVWIYSGDVDSVVPVTSTKYSIDSLKVDVKTPWKAWYASKEVGGYVVVYDGLTFATVRGAGHMVPSYQPERALVLVSSFLQGSFPTSS